MRAGAVTFPATYTPANEQTWSWRPVVYQNGRAAYLVHYMEIARRGFEAWMRNLRNSLIKRPMPQNDHSGRPYKLRAAQTLPRFAYRGVSAPHPLALLRSRRERPRRRD